jgi:large subunit ribosomal protein L15
MPLTRRLPKFGFTNIFRTKYQVVNLSALEGFEAGTEVDPGLLRKAGLIRRVLPVKLLADGTLDRALVIRVHAASAAARAKVEAAGGRIEILGGEEPKPKK